ncbi:MAG: ATP-binding protein [Crocinitomicaceae bacterium]|nr:ATP-binding protein [Crocinitomicaceae bacterium]
MRIAFTGPESTGKSTLAAWTAEHFGAEIVTEYARTYLSEKKTPYALSDLQIIAKSQQALWDEKRNEKLVFYDTEFLVLKIWAQERFNEVPEIIQAGWLQQKIDHYFLCFPDTKWEFDELRENPNDRERLYQIYKAALIEENYSFTELRGTWLEKQNAIQSKVEQLMKKV